MSKKAEKESIKKYPDQYSSIDCVKCFPNVIRAEGFVEGYDKAVEDVFAYLKEHYLLRRTKIPMHWVSHEQVKQKFIDNE